MALSYYYGILSHYANVLNALVLLLNIKFWILDWQYIKLYLYKCLAVVLLYGIQKCISVEENVEKHVMHCALMVYFKFVYLYKLLVKHMT